MVAWPAMRANVQGSHPDSPRRVRNVCRKSYNTNLRTALFESARRCCFFTVDGSACPLRVGAGNTQPLLGRPLRMKRRASTQNTRPVIGTERRAAAVLPCVTSTRLVAKFTCSHRSRNASSGRSPMCSRPATASTCRPQMAASTTPLRPNAARRADCGCRSPMTRIITSPCSSCK